MGRVGVLDMGREVVLGVVGDVDGFVRGPVGDDGQHRADDFFAGDGHAGRDVRKDGGTDVVAVV